jgi:hypothetical protein
VRKMWWLGTLFAAAALVLPALAQQPAGQPNANSFFTGADPRKLTLSKVDTTKAMKTSSIGKAMQSTTAQRLPSVFSAKSVFPRVTLGSWPPKLPSFGSTPTPVQKSMTVQQGAVNVFKSGPSQ